MICNIKLFISFFILCLSFLSFYSKASTCPPVETIKRIKGEYVWQTTEPGWMGYFAAPTPGKGRSYRVEKFVAATWVKTSDAEDSAGFIQCQYSGNFVGITTKVNPNYEQELSAYQNLDQAVKDRTPPPVQNTEVAANEIIRFVQTNANGALTPDTKNNWLCSSVTRFPSEACQCFNGIEKCNFHLA